MADDVTGKKSGETLVGLVSDTHGKLHPELYTVFKDVHLIIHAGDIGDLSIITELEQIAPVKAVRGNTDGWLTGVSDRELFQLEWLQILVLHELMLNHNNQSLTTLPKPDLVVFGHTHQPHISQDKNNTVLVNPGSAGPRRFNIPPSAGLLRITPDRLEIKIVALENDQPQEVLPQEILMKMFFDRQSIQT